MLKSTTGVCVLRVWDGVLQYLEMERTLLPPSPETVEDLRLVMGAKKLVSWSYRTAPELMVRLPLRLPGEFTVIDFSLANTSGFTYIATEQQTTDIAKPTRRVKIAWIALCVVMILLYLFFNGH